MESLPHLNVEEYYALPISDVSVPCLVDNRCSIYLGFLGTYELNGYAGWLNIIFSTVCPVVRSSIIAVKTQQLHVHPILLPNRAAVSAEEKPCPTRAQFYITARSRRAPASRLPYKRQVLMLVVIYLHVVRTSLSG